MENIIPRQRYLRNSSPARRRKKAAFESTSLLVKILRQAFFCLLVFIIIFTIKSINSPVTNFMSDKIKAVLFQNIELKTVYTGINDVVNKFIDAVNKKENDKVNDNSKSQQEIPKDVESKADKVSVEGKSKDSNTDTGVVINNNVNVKSTPEPLSSEKANLMINNFFKENENTNNSKIIKSISTKFSFIAPVKGEISSSFGYRTHPLLNRKVFHNGIDIKGDKGQQIKASLDGVVSETGNDTTYGNYIIISSQGKVDTVYAHCFKINVKKGSKISKGQVIGQIGDTGLAAGPHLHFEVRINKTVYDPMNFIKVS